MSNKAVTFMPTMQTKIILRTIAPSHQPSFINNAIFVASRLPELEAKLIEHDRRIGQLEAQIEQLEKENDHD